MTAARRLAFLAAAAAAVVVAPAPARAGLPLSLTWDAPAGCPTAAAVRAELDRLVRFPAGQAPPPISAEAHIEARDGRWFLRLRTVRDGVPGERALEADSCASLAHAATLVLALAFGVGDEVAPPPPPPERPARPAPRPKIVEAPPPPPVEAAPPPPPPPPPPPAAPPTIVAKPAPAPRPSLLWAIFADARGSRGPLPDLGGNAGLGVAVRAGRLSAALRLGAWLPTDDAASPTAARMKFSGAGLDVYLCAAPASGARATLWACAQGGAAALRGTSTGGLDEMPKTAPWYTAGAALRAEVRLTRRLALDARVEGVGSLTRPEFNFAIAVQPGPAYTRVYTVPVVVPAAALGLSLTL